MDDLFVSPAVHMMVGAVVLLTGLAAMVVAVRAAMKRQPAGRNGNLLFVLFQLALMVQVLIGIKLLDQGLGPLQLFVHYLAGWLRWASFCFTIGCVRLTAWVRVGERPSLRWHRSCLC